MKKRFFWCEINSVLILLPLLCHLSRLCDITENLRTSQFQRCFKIVSPSGGGSNDVCQVWCDKFVTTQQRSVSVILCHFVTSLLKWQSVHTLVKWQVTEVIFSEEYVRRFHQCNQTMAVSLEKVQDAFYCVWWNFK